jgi:hypothetical protein
MIGEIEEDETKLKMVNQQIKSTLSELLNCESVRSDRRYSIWVQTRLMDAEKELKRDRTRSCERKVGLLRQLPPGVAVARGTAKSKLGF